MLSDLSSEERRGDESGGEERRKPGLGMGSQEDPQATECAGKWNGIPGKRARPTAQSKGTGSEQERDTQQKVWRCQANQQGVWVRSRRKAWKELPLWASTAEQGLGRAGATRGD